MADIVLQFSPDDAEFRTALEKQFGDQVLLAKVKSFDGIECIQAIVTIVMPLAPFVLDFLVNRLRERKQRIVLTSEGDISLDNYSVDEAKDLLIQLASKSEQ